MYLRFRLGVGRKFETASDFVPPIVFQSSNRKRTTCLRIFEWHAKLSVNRVTYNRSCSKLLVNSNLNNGLGHLDAFVVHDFGFYTDALEGVIFFSNGPCDCKSISNKNRTAKLAINFLK